MTTHLIVALGAAFLLLLFLFGRRGAPSRARTMKSIVFGILVLNGLLILGAGLVLVAGPSLQAQEETRVEEVQVQTKKVAGGGGGWADMAAAIAVGIATIGAGIAVAVTGSAAIGGITQNPDIFGRSLVFVGLAEGIAIYGLIIAFMILAG